MIWIWVLQLVLLAVAVYAFVMTVAHLRESILTNSWARARKHAALGAVYAVILGASGAGIWALWP